MMYMFYVKLQIIHFCLKSLLRVILPPNFSWDNNTYYYGEYLEDGLNSFIWSPYGVNMSS